MTESFGYMVALFESVSYVLRSEELLKEAGVQFKLIPVPKSIHTNCGICIRFAPADRPRIEEALRGRVAISDIRDIPKQ
jgi:hypothetical protein